PVESIRLENDGVKLCAAGQEVTADFGVLAVPFDALARLLPDESASSELREQLARFETSPITGVHLWFDREITKLDHAVLLDRTIQWMFNKSKILGRSDGGSYLELVVSASNSLVEKSRAEIVDLALRELAEFFPRIHEAKIVKSTVIKEVNATYSPRPGADAHRPSALTA